MRTVFADSFYFFALGNRHDPAHETAVAFSETYTGRLLTTGFVLMEVADGCAASPRRRAIATQLAKTVRDDPNIFLVPCSQSLFNDALELFEQRSDKTWSLTDCTSFVAMERESVIEALTGDKHFEQAGFVALLK